MFGCKLALQWFILCPEALPHSKMARGEWGVSYQLHNIASTHYKMYDGRDSKGSSVTGEKYDIEFITSSSLLQMSTLIQVTLPHSLTSSQGQSGDQFLVKSPAPPLASAPGGILGSWPLPPPPGLCWYGCGCEQLLVGQLEGISRETALLSESYIKQRHMLLVLCVHVSPNGQTACVKNEQQRLSSGMSHKCVAWNCLLRSDSDNPLLQVTTDESGLHQNYFSNYFFNTGVTLRMSLSLVSPC